VHLFSRKEDETRRKLEQQAEQARKYELEQVSYLEEQKRKREEFQRYLIINKFCFVHKKNLNLRFFC
jgi:hypothetical protein